MIKFDTLVTAAFGGSGEAQTAGLADERVAELFRMAWELDGLKGRIEMNAREMAMRFTRYADDLDGGRNVYDPPTGWSTLRDLDKDATKFQTIHEIFKNLFYPVTGVSLRKVRDEIEAATELKSLEAKLAREEGVST